MKFSFSLWRPFIVLGVVLVAALGLRLYAWIRGPVVPTADVPAVEWEAVVEGREENEGSEGISRGNVGITLGNVGISRGSVGIEGSEGNEGDGEEVKVGGDEEGGVGRILPDAINLAVPFTSQAPQGIWDAFTEETCEEASFAMVSAYYAGLSVEKMDPALTLADLQAMVALQESLEFGVSISTEQFAVFSEMYDGTAVRIVENPSVDDLRALLAAGHPVIVPAYGRKLGNPFFTGEGPLYHMLVLRGYTPTSFITNDPGTRHGENYQYSFAVFMQAIGDWDGDSPDGGSRVIVFDR